MQYCFNFIYHGVSGPFERNGKNEHFPMITFRLIIEFELNSEVYLFATSLSYQTHTSTRQTYIKKKHASWAETQKLRTSCVPQFVTQIG